MSTAVSTTWANLSTTLAGLTTAGEYALEITDPENGILDSSSVSGSLGYKLINDISVSGVLIDLTPTDLTQMPYESSTHNLFYSCTHLYKIGDLQPAIINGQNCFSYSTNLISASLNGLTNMTSGYEMFNGCSSLVNVSMTSLALLTSGYAMFKGCSSLVIIDISGLTSLTSAASLFQGDSALTTIYNWKIDAASAYMTNCFDGCTSLAHIYTTSKLPSVTGQPWRVVRLEPGASSTGYKIYARDGTLSYSGTVTHGTQTKWGLAGYIQSLGFATTISDTMTENLVKGFTFTVNGIDATEKYFIVVADDPDHVYSNCFKLARDTASSIYLVNSESTINKNGVASKTVQQVESDGGVSILALTAATYYDIDISSIDMSGKEITLEFHNKYGLWVPHDKAGVESLHITRLSNQAVDTGVCLTYTSGCIRIRFPSNFAMVGSTWNNYTSTDKTWAKVIGAADGYDKWRIKIS